MLTHIRHLTVTGCAGRVDNSLSLNKKQNQQLANARTGLPLQVAKEPVASSQM